MDASLVIKISDIYSCIYISAQSCLMPFSMKPGAVFNKTCSNQAIHELIEHRSSIPQTTVKLVYGGSVIRTALG